MYRPRTVSLVAAATACALTLAACGSDSNDSSSTASAPASTAAATTTAAKSGIEQSTIDTGLKYTGGTAGKADASLAPVTIGLEVQKGGTPAFPEYEASAKAAAKLVNEELGGIGGHPLAFDECVVTQSEEDGQKCGVQFLDKKVPLVLWTLSVVGNDSYYKTIGGKVPTLVSVSGNGADYSAKSTYELDGGGIGVLTALAKRASAQGLKKVALVSSSNPAGKFATSKLLEPALKDGGVAYKTIYISDTATTPDFASALQAAGASSADGVILVPPSAAQCIATFEAMKQLSIDKPVYTSTTCASQAFLDKSKGAADNWEYYGFTANPRIDSPETNAYRNAMETYGAGETMFTNYSPRPFGDVLAITKFANAIGADALTSAALLEQIRAFRGPMFMVPGKIACDHNPTFAAICGDSANGSVQKAGVWSSVGDIQTVTLKP